MSSSTKSTASVRQRVRLMIARVRCESRFVSRHVFNRAAVRRFRSEAIELDTVGEAIVRDLSNDGVVLTSVGQLAVDDQFDLILRYTQDLRDSGAARPDSSKPYLTELLGSSPELDPENPILRLALSPQIRGVAEGYSAMKLKVQDVNVWINAPQGGNAQQSQRWHRDLPEDHDIVKCFVYLKDVPPGAGPLQYVRKSNTSAGRRQRFDTEFDGVGFRLADSDVATSFDTGDIVQAAGPAGTVVFADTRGIHRGGQATETERVVLQITYGSDAAYRPRNLRPAPGVSSADLPDVRLVNA